MGTQDRRRSRVNARRAVALQPLLPLRLGHAESDRRYGCRKDDESADSISPKTSASFPMTMRTPAISATLALGIVLTALCTTSDAAGGRWLRGARSPASTGTPRNQAPYWPGASPYETAHGTRPKYYVPPTNPGTPTWKMYGTPPGVVPGDWPRYAPLGFGGYRFPASGSQAYR